MGKGGREETGCQRQDRKDVVGLMRREEGRVENGEGEGMAGRACLSAGCTLSSRLGSPALREAQGSVGKAVSGQRGRQAGKMEKQ